jgi:phosphopantothenoylcysteine decarboxylase/phosphopantothenate--cysteine ligase
VRVLVTAGPTREYLDAVRFISNPSTGKMGFACARAAARAGHRVTLVSGPVALRDPAGLRTIRITTAEEMYRAVMEVLPRIDAVIMTAAVGDYRPVRPFRGKLKKKTGSLTLHLGRTRDILQEIGAKKGGRILVGFALEVQDALQEAMLKYKKKNLDFVILNTPATFAADRMDCQVYREGTIVKEFRKARKEAVARWIVRAITAFPARTEPGSRWGRSGGPGATPGRGVPRGKG